MADITLTAAYGSVVEDEEEGCLFVGFAEGETEDEDYVLFRQKLTGGPVWVEVSDEAFAAEDAVQSVEAGPRGLTLTLRPEKVARFGHAATVEIRIGPGGEDAAPALEALAEMLGSLYRQTA